MGLNRIKKVVLEITVISLILIWGMGLAIIKLEYNYLIITEKEKLERFVQTEAVKIGKQLDIIHFFLRELAQMIELSNYDSLKDDKQIEAFIASFVNQSDGNFEIKVAYENGALSLFYSQPDELLANISDRDYFKAQNDPETRGFYIGKPVINRISGSWVLPFSFPLKKNSNGMFLISATVKYNAFEQLHLPVTAGKNIKITNIRDDGTVLFRFPTEYELLGTSVPDDIFKLISSDGSGSIILKKNYIIRNKHLFMHESVPDYPVKVVIDLDYSVMKSKWLFRSIIRIAIHLISTAIIIFLIMKFWNILNELKTTQDQLEKSARYDCLTALSNRSYFYERFKEELDRSLRYKTALLLVSIDLDHFKKINDTYGHPEGDAVLAKFGEILKSCIRTTDFTGRVGGEEFAVILPETDIKAGLIIAERIRISIHSITLKEGHVTASMGISQLKDNDTIDSLFLRTDKALYKAKNSGRDCIIVE